MNPIVERIQKLLALASSSNEHEAKLAADKANELLVKHNLSMQQVQAAGEEYTVDSIERKTRLLMDEQLLLNRVIKPFFFVEVVSDYSKSNPPHSSTIWIQFLGKEENVAIAKHVHIFLIRTMRQAWLDYKDAYGKSEKSRSTFADGFCDGLVVQLKQTRKKVETSMGLVVVADPKLKEFVQVALPGTKKSQIPGARNADDHANEVGFEEGKKVRIQKSLSGEATDSGKYIGGGK